MASLCFVLLLSGLCVQSSVAFPPTHYTQHASFQTPDLTKSQSSQLTGPEQQKAPAEEPEQVNTVRVTCHPDSMEITIQADMFGVGAPVQGDELRLGVENNAYCRAAAISREEYRIFVGLMDCGTKHWMTHDNLVYTNLLIYSPEASPDGLIRMDEAVVPVECHYERKYSLSSSSLTPTWVPFTSTQAAVETLDFNLRIMTNDWLYERGSNVFFLGEPISIEASVRLGYHMGLRVFVSSCVATLDPDIYSVPRYVFVDNGCLVDSQLPGSRSHFLPRMQDDKLHMVIDAFRFHNEDRGQLYVTCHLTVVPVNDAEVPNKACTLINGRWRSVDSNDFLCGQCQNPNEAGQTLGKPSSPGKFSPRGFGKPAESKPSWRSTLKANMVWEQEARVGPMLVLPAKPRSGPLPVEDLPPVLDQISRPSLYSSQWRSGATNRRVDLKQVHGPSTPDLVEEGEDEIGTDGDEENEAAPLEKMAPEIAMNNVSTTASTDVSPTAPIKLDVTLSNATATESDTNYPKRK
ncbi:zona pellucida sperm-binding protein 3-like [Hippoglossus hippoglossus]|uniref:zona pellucida sperm-binding protein 3-like n=1 Tax=Hippoglossus hippoglossus TaxID=8267 RepID=UPI00148CF7F0|nr:zona pellucida sperm-binding protein 3-like [Hippoglossus hippoglossus]